MDNDQLNPNTATRSADLEIYIDSQEKDGYLSLTYTLHSPNGVAPYQHFHIPTTVNAGKREEYERLFDRVANLNHGLDAGNEFLLNEEIPRKLEGFGRDLYQRLFPAELHEAYRRFRIATKTLCIITRELSIPWELIKPYDSSGSTLIDDDFLSIQFQLTFWSPDYPLPPPFIRVSKIMIIKVNTPLPGIEAEQENMTNLLSATHPEIELLIATHRRDVLHTLENSDIGIIHFAGNAQDNPNRPSESGILLDDGAVLRAEDLHGPIREALSRQRPFVFLNCTAGSGWPDRLLRQCRAGAFITTLFPMKDSQAFEFSKTVYAAVERGETIASAINVARKHLRGGGPGQLGFLSPRVWAHPNTRLIFGAAEEDGPYEPPAGRLSGAINDQAAQTDRLGFENYAEAFAELIQSVETQLPLTIGIFGSWGVGKTTLMELITRKLRDSPLRPQSKEPNPEPTISRVHIITFSAWEYSAREAIWPGLVRKIMDGLEKEISWPFPGRFLTKLGWNLRSALKKERGRIFVIGCILVAAAAAAVTLFLERDLANEDLWKPLLAAGVTGLAGILGGALKIVGDTLSRPMGQWLTTAFQEDAYGRPIAHFAKIREDLQFLDKRLNVNKKRPERALIVIDDLDRCEPGKAVEMLQAVKLLLDFKSFVVCMGIDARIITRVVEKHYKDLLGEAGASGYEYLDKIVQIPFRIPVPEKKQIEEFLAEQMGNPQPPQPDGEPVKTASADSPRSGTQEPARTGGEGTAAAHASSPLPSAPAPPRSTASAFTHRELQAFQSMAECLRANPRHLKRLLNVYRLVRTLADMRGEQILLDKPGAAICWVVLCAQWPYTTYLMLSRLKHAEEKKDFELPKEDPLTWLLTEVRKEIDPEVRKRLDQDPNLLLRLIQECPDARMSWDELRTIRRYTINFNPAIELEAIAEARPARPVEDHST